jgi:serine/threonine protein kinase
MNRVEKGIAELTRSFDETLYPEEFLNNSINWNVSRKDMGRKHFWSAKKATPLYMWQSVMTNQLIRTSMRAKFVKTALQCLPKFKAAFENNRVLLTVRTYIEGVPLDHFVKKCALSETQIIALCVQLCDILSYLHGQDKPIIHRDIKPQNIIVQPDGTIVLIDFDIARQYREDAETDTQCFGTRLYAPPEQYGFSQTDCRADIYSLGVLLSLFADAKRK